MIEVLAGNGIDKAFKDLKIVATQTFKDDESGYEVWEMSKPEYKKLELYCDNELNGWANDWGWFRYAKGSNMGTPCSIYTIGNHELIAWDGFKREKLRDDWDDKPNNKKVIYHCRFSEYEEDVMPKKYNNILEYYINELGASTEKNVCALSVDLARANGMTMANLFKTYM